jgi:hypothetical protein
MTRGYNGWSGACGQVPTHNLDVSVSVNETKQACVEMLLLSANKPYDNE